MIAGGPSAAGPASPRVERSLAPARQPSERAHQLTELLLPCLRLGVHQAGADVILDQADGHLVQRRLDGRDLLQDVDAVAVLLDHPLDAADLPLDPGKAPE